MSSDDLQPLHRAVLARSPETVRLLMEEGADARAGIYPHRDATSPLTIATERGYTEIVEIIEQAERRRPATSEPVTDGSGSLVKAVRNAQPEVVAELLAQGADPNKGYPLWHCAGSGMHKMAQLLLDYGADPNAQVATGGSPMFPAYAEMDQAMIALLTRYGGVPQATTAGLFRQTELAKQMLAGEAKYLLDGVGGDTLAEQLLWGSSCGGDPETVRLALERVDWPRDDPRWFPMLEQPLRIWKYGSASAHWDRATYVACFELMVQRCAPNITGRFGITILHSVAGLRGHVTSEECVAFATMLLNRGARFDTRDAVLLSTPLGWACRWGRMELVKLFLGRGAEPIEPDAQPWATPASWAAKMAHGDVLALLRDHGKID